MRISDWSSDVCSSDLMTKFNLPIFRDLKLHDIPNTVAKAIQALHGLQPAILTVHAAGGRAMLEDAKAAASAGRSEERRVGKECVSTFSTRVSPYTYKKTKADYNSVKSRIRTSN